jgi:hypothetical protein
MAVLHRHREGLHDYAAVALGRGGCLRLFATAVLAVAPLYGCGGDNPRQREDSERAQLEAQVLRAAREASREFRRTSTVHCSVQPTPWRCELTLGDTKVTMHVDVDQGSGWWRGQSTTVGSTGEFSAAVALFGCCVSH